MMRHKKVCLQALSLSALPMLILAQSDQLVAQFAAAENRAAAEHVTKVYNIADLLEPPAMLDHDRSKQNSAGVHSEWGGAAVGGGGVFRIPENILPQMAGLEGGLGGGMGGFGGGFAGPKTPPESMTRQALEDIVVDHLSDEATPWKSVDGTGGTLSIVGSLLVVTHTAEVHQRVSQLLDLLRAGSNTSPTVDVSVRIVEIGNDVETSSLDDSLQALEKLAESPNAARLSIRCENNRLANVSSGLRRSYVVSTTPVVGSNGATIVENDRGIGYRPVTESVLLGLFGKMRPEINPDKASGKIHLGIELASGPEEVMEASFGSGQSIDRVEIASARLQTSVVSKAGIWTLAGTVAVTDPTSGLTSGAALPHLAIMVKWSPVD